jgi:hypothetical protein
MASSSDNQELRSDRVGGQGDGFVIGDAETEFLDD